MMSDAQLFEIIRLVNRATSVLQESGQFTHDQVQSLAELMSDGINGGLKGSVASTIDQHLKKS